MERARSGTLGSVDIASLALSGVANLRASTSIEYETVTSLYAVGAVA